MAKPLRRIEVICIITVISTCLKIRFIVNQLVNQLEVKPSIHLVSLVNVVAYFFESVGYSGK